MRGDFGLRFKIISHRLTSHAKAVWILPNLVFLGHLDILESGLRRRVQAFLIP